MLLLGLVACAAPSKPPGPPALVQPLPAERAAMVAPLPAAPARLPHVFEPVRYVARLHVAPRQTAFSGAIEIEGVLAEPAALVWIHGEGLMIDRAEAVRGAVRVPLVARGAAPSMVALQSVQPLAPGTWTLSIAYRGEWSAHHASGGFRKSVDGMPYVFSHFEPDFARRVFPCFDEPDRKVPWQLTLEIPDGLVAASNTAIESETRDAAHGTKTVRFAPTAPLPSYLVAFAVGPFDVVDAGTSKSGIPIRVLTLRGDAPLAAHAAASAPQLLDRVETWLGVRFPYPKADFVAVPQTESWWLAMENAGLVAFHTDLLHSATKWDEVAMHELAHHWFGDYVTPAWWDDIWLNESFAYWISQKLAGGRPRSQVAVDSPIIPPHVRDPRRGLGADQSFASPEQLGIEKGILLLHMLEATVGADVLSRALRDYLAAHPHGTVHTADLSRAIATATSEPIAATLEHYLHAGTHSLAATLRCTRTERRIEITEIEQSALVCVAYDHDGRRDDRCARLGDGTTTIELPAKRCPRWFWPRAVERVEIDQRALESLRDRGWSALSADEQLAAIDEVLGHDPTKGRLRLSFIARAAHSDDAAMIGRITAYLVDTTHLVPPSLRPKYDAWIGKHFSARARATPVASTDADTRQLMMPLWLVAMDAGDQAVRHDAAALLPQLDKLDAVQRRIVLRAAVLDTPSFADTLLRELPNASGERSEEIVFAIEGAPDLLDVLLRHTSDLAALPWYMKLRLIGQLCDEARRAEVERLAREIAKEPDRFALRGFEWCLRERKALEPELRAFLNAKP